MIPISDFTSYFNLNYNTGTDASPNFTGSAITFGGSGGAEELRWAVSGASTSTPSATWPYVARPNSGILVIPQLWAFTTNTAGTQVNYDGTSAHWLVMRFSWDAVGTFAGAPLVTAYGSTAHNVASPGTQPGTDPGSPVINGTSVDTSSTSYLKANFYGFGYGSAQETPGSASGLGTASATSGSAGAITTATGTWSGWQSLQAGTQWILNGTTPPATTAGYWYWQPMLYTGQAMYTGLLQPCITFQYSYS